jgi:dihydroorotate dehydrogenase (NAD+) catalytic subunit
MPQIPFYDPNKSYEENYSNGPFGLFADGKKFVQSGEPQYDFFGQKVYLPLGIPAGPLLNGKFVRAALDHGFDITVYKTVRTRKHPCHPWPNVLSLDINGNLTEEQAKRGVFGHHNYGEPLSITNSFGVPSFDPDIWQQDLADCVRYAHKGQVVVGSFQGTVNSNHNSDAYVQDFVLAARLVKETGVKVLEANLSCPNEGHSNMLCFDIERTFEITVKIKEEIGNTPLVLKLSYFHDSEHLREFVEKVGKIADGFSAINTLPAKIVDEDGNKRLPGDGRDISGVCGHAIKWAGLDMVKKLRSLREEFGYSFSIEGVGGVTVPEDYFEYLKIGADSVMTATGAMWNPLFAQETKQRVQNAMERIQSAVV